MQSINQLLNSHDWSGFMSCGEPDLGMSWDMDRNNVNTANYCNLTCNGGIYQNSASGNPITVNNGNQITIQPNTTVTGQIQFIPYTSPNPNTFIFPQTNMTVCGNNTVSWPYWEILQKYSKDEIISMIQKIRDGGKAQLIFSMKSENELEKAIAIELIHFLSEMNKKVEKDGNDGTKEKEVD